MKYRKLGRTGINVSEIGFGAWAIGGGWGEQDEKDSITALHKALDLGINFIDTAAGYGNGKSERIIAKVLKERREEIFVATKTPPANSLWPTTPYCAVEDRFSETYIRQNVEERLWNLNTDCIDLLQLHTWTRAWNNNPSPYEVLKKLKDEGKIRFVGISTPEQDQNSVIDIMRNGHVDVVQVIYNLFEQEPAAALLPIAAENNIGIIVRVAFDEGVLTGKYSANHKFAPDDFRSKYFVGDRLAKTVERVEQIKNDINGTAFTMPQTALKFVLSHPAVSTVITGIRSVQHAEANTAVPDQQDLPEDLLLSLRKHMWNRADWHSWQ